MSKKVYCVVDIGGTKTLLLLIDQKRQVLFRDKYATPGGVKPEQLAGAIQTSAAAALKQSGLVAAQLAGLGVCVAALVDYEHGCIYQSPNLGWYQPVDFKSILQKGLTCPVYLDNDANAAVLGEVYYGAARGHRDVVYVTISTGIGGGLYLDGKLYRGSGGFAGEIGHIKPFGQGRRCGCGGMDCLEAWAGGTAISRSASLLWDARESTAAISTAWVFDQAEAGNPLAQTLISRAEFTISTGLANMVTLLNPSCLVIGGSIAANRAQFLAQIREQIYRIAIAPSVEATRVEVVAALLEPEAGVWGMYALMQNENGGDVDGAAGVD
ncbi:MAG: ROK family protein [Bacillota bacterium]